MRAVASAIAISASYGLLLGGRALIVRGMTNKLISDLMAYAIELEQYGILSRAHYKRAMRLCALLDVTMDEMRECARESLAAL